MSEELTKKLADELMKQEGEARGMHLYSDREYVLKEEGKEGLEKMEKILERVGHPLDYNQMKRLSFYPIGTRPMSLLAMKEAFGWGTEEVRQVCRYAATDSLIIRLYLKHFGSLAQVAKKAPEIWREYFSTGELEVSDYSETEKYAVIEIRDADLHPSFCRCLEGYFESFIKMVVEAEDIEVEERKCTFEGDKLHEYYLSWD